MKVGIAFLTLLLGITGFAGEDTNLPVNINKILLEEGSLKTECALGKILQLTVKGLSDQGYRGHHGLFPSFEEGAQGQLYVFYRFTLCQDEGCHFPSNVHITASVTKFPQTEDRENYCVYNLKMGPVRQSRPEEQPPVYNPSGGASTGGRR